MSFLSGLETFARVVELGSLSAAARARRVSLAAVSRQLAELEREVGAALVLRSTRRMSVTDAGREMYLRAVRILREVEDARTASRARGVAGRLVVSAGVTLGQRWLMPRLAPLVASRPALVVELRLEDALVDLIADGVDVALRGGVAPPDSTVVVAPVVATFHRWLVAAPAYLRTRRSALRDPAQLADHDALVQLRQQGAAPTWTLEPSRGNPAVVRTIALRERFAATAPAALREAALAGLGVALLPDWLVADDLAARRLRRILPQWRSPPVSIWAIHRVEQRGNARIGALLDALRADAVTLRS